MKGEKGAARGRREKREADREGRGEKSLGAAAGDR
jgi:hypothetical protein